MEKNSIVEAIDSYNVNKDLVENLASCLQKRVRVLLSPELANADFLEKNFHYHHIPRRSGKISEDTRIFKSVP